MDSTPAFSHSAKRLLLCATLLMACATTVTGSPVRAASRLQVGRQDSPVVGVATPFPKLSWLTPHSERGQRQHAYRVVVLDVATSKVAWDTGRVESCATSLVYAGRPLKSNTDYNWTVTWWDIQGRRSGPSDVGAFHTALVGGDRDWSGVHWIAGDGNMLRRDFTLTTLPSAAHAFISGLGWFQLFVNGHRVGTDALSVGWTRYDKRDQYATYDVTKFLTAGDNTVGVLLGYGWRNDTAFKPRDGQTVGPYQRMLRMQVLDTANARLVASDASWGITAGPIVMDSVYDGETYDARLEQPGWNAPRFTNASAWSTAVVTPGPGGIMFAPPMPPIAVTDEFEPVSLTTLDAANVVVDFGRNFAGFCRIRVKGAAGTTVVLRHAEVLMHEPYGPRNGDIYTANLRTARATDTFILKGTGDWETFQPHFTYHGFRYVKVTGYPGTLTADDITALHFHTNLTTASSFESSSYTITTIQANALFGQQSNLMSVPTDCDQRDERLGWMGDAGLSADAMAMNFPTETFHGNYLDNIHDEQDGDGSLPDVTPFYRYGNRPADVSWSAAFPQILWVMTTHYHAFDVVAQHWDGLGLYLSNLAAQLSGVGGDIALMPGTYGDWVTPNQVNRVSVHYTSGFNYIVNLWQAADIASALGHTSNVTALTSLATTLAQDFHTAWYHAMNYSFADGRQTSFALALFAPGVVPATDRDHVANGLLNALITRQQLHVSTGIIGAKALFPTLSAIGRTDTAVGLLEQLTWPSWGFMAFNDLEPATTLWELWSAPWKGPGMNSRNHHMFSSVSQWILERVGGLSPPTCHNNGTAPISVRVASTVAISSAHTKLDGYCGEVDLSWRRHGGMQCSTIAQNYGPTNKYLPRHDGLQLSCGSKGGTISRVVFASFGTPFGTCGGFAVNHSCHAPQSMATVTKLCVGKSSCTIPTDAQSWGNPCPGTVGRMFAQVQCTGAPVVVANLTMASGVSDALVNINLHGLDRPTITDNGKAVWADGRFQHGVAGVTAGSYSPSNDTVILAVSPGTYSFELHGQSPGQVACFTSTAVPSGITIQCPSPGTVITHVEFATYGNYSGTTCGAYSVGEQCNLGSAQAMVERNCIGHPMCVTPSFVPSMFQDFAPACAHADPTTLGTAVQVVCSERVS